MKIKRIGFENFRVFKDRTNFELTPITVLTGTNSSGKSTIIKGLKLFQSFWNQDEFNKLQFEKGKHQLGDYEMTISKDSNTKTLTVTYEFDHIVFNTLLVELIFQLDESSPLKNGYLERTLIKRGNTILYYVLIKENKLHYAYNYEYILNDLFPLLSEATKYLLPEFENYKKKISEDAELNTLKNGLNIRFLDMSKSKLNELNINQEKFWELESLFNYDFSKEYANYEPSKLNLKSPIFIYNLKMLDLFSQIEKSNSINFIEEFWNVLKQRYPEIENRFNYLTFKEFVENLEEKGKLHIHIWKESYLLSEEHTFDLFLRKQIELSLEIISKTFITTPWNIDDLEGIAKQSFYNPAKPTSETIWQSFYKHAIGINIDNQTINEKAVVNCHQIVSDALYLEQEILGEDLSKKELTVFPKFERFFTNLYKTIEDYFSQIYFIDSIRATSDRLYILEGQNLNFNEFIVSFLKRNFNETEKIFIEKWLREFEIADKFEIELVQGVGCQIFLIKDNEKINLVDLGYGVTQFLPILLKIIYCNNTGKKRIVIEEPETNLHPNFQSKLAGLFVDAYNTFDIQFIIETHSEYFIRKLQFLTAKGDIDPSESIIYYLANPNKDKRVLREKQVKEIHIQSNGRLSEPFGSGFYDEADNLSLEMIKYSLN